MNTQEAINIVCGLPAEKQARNSMQAGLQITQLEEWDNTTFLSDAELIAGLNSRGYGPMDWTKTVTQYRSNYPDAVAYSVIDGTGRLCYGIRYGFRGEQYISF